MHLENKCRHWEQFFPYRKLRKIGKTCARHECFSGEHARAGRQRPRFLVKEGVFPRNFVELDEKVQQQYECCVKDMPPKTSGKNKRGERGSTDEETADPKCVNMASADFEPSEVVEGEDDQPNLSDIHATLKDLLKSMNKLYNEVTELKASFKLQESEPRKAKD